ncbi:MAG: CpaF family protein, partial [Actinobacteria bacterium]|nr:CpaF family protein [Actinomycetota bacterium]
MRLLGETEALEASVRRRFAAETGSVNAATRLAELFAEEAPLLATVEVQSRAHALAVELVGLGPIQMLIDDPAVTDVLVNGPGEVWIERNGRLERSGVIADKDLIARSIERLVGPLGLRADRSNPIVDARLPDGTRVAVVLPPLAVDGPVLAIRRHRADPLALSAFAGPAVVQLLESLVREQLNLVVYGPTGAGKTSLLNALVAGIPPNERVVTIEDVAELRLPGEHVVRLEARP